jgi:hypothetical protein
MQICVLLLIAKVIVVLVQSITYVKDGADLRYP